MFELIVPKSRINSKPFLQWMPTPQGEEKIVWLVDPSKFFFCRARIFYSARRESKPHYNGDGVLLGWTILGKDQGCESSGFYRRRYFYLQADDLKPDCVYLLEGCHPTEGVDPKTVKPGVWGLHLQPKYQGNYRLISSGVEYVD